MNTTDLELLFRLLLAAAMGGIIGIERERLQWAAGLRTHMLVCVGSAVFMMVSAHGFDAVLVQGRVVLDPSRVAAQVVSGIGFLGAGTILLRRDRIRGLTTAASLWTVAAIGLAVGGGQYVLAVGATVVVFAVLAGIKPIEQRLWERTRGRVLIVQADTEKVSLSMLEAELVADGIAIMGAVIERGPETSEAEIRLSIPRPSSEVLEALLRRIRAVDGVKSVRVGR